MNTPQKQPDGVWYPTTRTNRRRLIVLVVVIFIAIISFFAGRHSWHTPAINPDAVNGKATDPSGREGIPPDSLPH